MVYLSNLTEKEQLALEIHGGYDQDNYNNALRNYMLQYVSPEETISLGLQQKIEYTKALAARDLSHLMIDPNVAYKLIMDNEAYIQFAPPEIAAEQFSRNGLLMAYASYEQRTNKNLAYLAIMNNPDCASFIPSHTRDEVLKMIKMVEQRLSEPQTGLDSIMKLASAPSHNETAFHDVPQQQRNANAQSFRDMFK